MNWQEWYKLDFLSFVDRMDLTWIQNFTPLGVWTLPVIVSLAIALILVLVLSVTSEARKVRYRFITVGSHKLRTPLSKIKVAVSELIQKKEAADVRKESYVLEDYDERMLRQITVEANRLVGLVNLLLEVSESEQKNSNYRFEAFNIIELTRGILTSYQNSQWRNDRVFIDLEAEDGELYVKADKHRIGSVVQVLLENAITYSPAGGKITVLIKKRRKSMLISITDHGMGITEKEKRYLFTKFYRSERALSVDTEGTGVGLFLAKHIVEGHGGEMWFESMGKFKGSTFYFTLPLARKPS